MRARQAKRKGVEVIIGSVDGVPCLTREEAKAAGYPVFDSKVHIHVVAGAKDTNPKDAIGCTKVPLTLLSPIAKAHWALAQYSGSLKYGKWNWRAAGVRSSIYLDAIDRHRDAYLSGETHDPVDGSHHLGNIMACCAILLDAEAAGKLTDDRPPSVGLRDAYKAVEDQMQKLRAQYADKAPRHYTIADTEKRTA